MDARPNLACSSRWRDGRVPAAPLMPDLGRYETAGARTAQTQEHAIEAWHVLVCGLQLAGDAFGLGASLTLRRIVTPLTVFDLAAGWRQPVLPSISTPLVSAIVLSYCSTEV